MLAKLGSKTNLTKTGVRELECGDTAMALTVLFNIWW